MKRTSMALLILCMFASYEASATAVWGNCGGGPQTEPIQDVFWKSDVNGSNGPEYTLKSGQHFSNAGAVCREGQALKSKDWIAELKKGINPAKSVTSFQVIQTADEFQKFLKNNAIEVEDLNRLHEVVAAYLESKPVNYESTSSMPGKAGNPTIIVGASNKEALILLASSDGKIQYATSMQIKLK